MKLRSNTSHENLAEHLIVIAYCKVKAQKKKMLMKHSSHFGELV